MKEPIPSLGAYAYSIIAKILYTFGPRSPGSSAEQAANLWLKDELSGYCDEVHHEEFNAYPGYYPQGIIRITAILATAAFLCMPVKMPLFVLSPVLALLAIGVLLAELGFLKRWIVFLFKKKRSGNVFGFIRPRGEVRARVLFEGHMDSAIQIKMVERDKVPLHSLLLGSLFLIYTLFYSVFRLFMTIFSDIAEAIIFQSGILLFYRLDFVYFLPALVLFPFLITLWINFTGRIIVPGASDNLSGCGVSAALGQYFDQQRPQHTEIIIGSMGSEEIGQMGAEYFSRKHPELLEDTYCFVLDDIGSGEEFMIIDRAYMHFTRYDGEMVALMQEAADKYAEKNPSATPVKIGRIPLGSSDATMYAKKGYRSAFMIAVSTADTRFNKPPYWHSVEDNLEHINKKRLEDAIGIGIKFVEIIDKKVTEKT
jgi:hypothetical protein